MALLMRTLTERSRSWGWPWFSPLIKRATSKVIQLLKLAVSLLFGKRACWVNSLYAIVKFADPLCAIQKVFFPYRSLIKISNPSCAILSPSLSFYHCFRYSCHRKHRWNGHFIPRPQKSWHLLGFPGHWCHQINKGVKTDNLFSQQMEKVIEAGIVLKELPIIKRG